MASILIVDDDKAATDLFERVMRSAGHMPTSVNESDKAMEVALQLKPDLILLDLMMPEPTGFQLCRMLRADPHFIFTPIVIVTALDDSDSRIVSFGAGANDYLIKPIRVDTLIDTVNELLGQEE